MCQPLIPTGELVEQVLRPPDFPEDDAELRYDPGLGCDGFGGYGHSVLQSGLSAEEKRSFLCLVEGASTAHNLRCQSELRSGNA